ncbi:MAG: EAL domain-containing protein [Gammaproteobacteria bacterium]|nr:EAL domain-containing protein [Gammaproteobacteria bacterium]
MPTVYLIDDEPELLELLSDVVELTGLSAQGYTRASMFFEQVPTFEPDSILVLDLHMPEMDGIEVMRRLAQMNNPPALILISGHDTGVLHSAEKLGQAHNLKIIASLGKPVTIGHFRQLLDQHTQSDKWIQRNDHQTIGRKFTEVELHRAIRDDHLTLHYQPQFEIATEKITVVEALVRWQHPEEGLVYPDRFIPLAEQNGLIGKLTSWVIEKVVQQEQQWQKAGLSVAVSVNISAVDITSLTLPEQLAELLADNKLDPTRLTLEVTESALMGELVTSLDILTRLRLKGIGLSIDDFGTGYSSLSQLHRVPFTELKIDRSFVYNITEDTEARSIVKTCILLGHELNMWVVAEGVETKEHLDILRQLCCDRAQGYLFSKPVPAEKMTERLHSET